MKRFFLNILAAGKAKETIFFLLAVFFLLLGITGGIPFFLNRGGRTGRAKEKGG